MTKIPQKKGKKQQADNVIPLSKKKDEKQPVRPHCKCSTEDINWIRQQNPTVQQLWLDCIAAEQYGGNAHVLQTSIDIKGKPFKKAKDLIQQQELFIFKPVHELLPSGQSKVVGWKVINLHGYYNRSYWELDTPPSGVEEGDIGNSTPHLQEIDIHTSGSSMPDFGNSTPPLQPETPAIQSVEKTQLPNNYQSTTHQLPTKVVDGMVEGVDNSKPQPEVTLPNGGDSAAVVTQENQEVVVCDEEEVRVREEEQNQGQSFPIVNNQWQHLSDRELVAMLEDYSKRSCYPGMTFLEECYSRPLTRLNISWIVKVNRTWGVSIENGCLIELDF